MMNQFDQLRIAQLTSDYSPAHAPQLPMMFGDYLSLLWRIDQAADRPHLEQYYRQCAQATARGLGLGERSIVRMVRITESGRLYRSLENAPYRATSRLVDAQDRRAAIRQMADLRSHILTMGAYREAWTVGWPGSRLMDDELRERLFAVFFTAFDGQFQHFSRLLLVIDIVLHEMLLGTRAENEVSLIRLIREFGYPDPDDLATLTQFRGDQDS